MGRPKDSDYWNKVTKEENGRLKCKQCGIKFKGGVSRIKAHVDRIQGKGIRICSSSSNNSQYATNDITTFLDDIGSYEMIDIVGSSSINHVNNTQPEPSLAGWAAEQAVNGSGPLESEINQLVFDLTSEEDDINKQLQSLESRGKKRKSHVDIWLNELRHLKKIAADLKNSMDQFWSIDLDVLIAQVRRHKLNKPLVLSNEFFGLQFEANVKEMWDLLVDRDVFIIGICGMGGVGKTFLATYMENEIKRNGTFKHVFWVTVSDDFNISKLQHEIAETVGVKLYRDDERSRAAILSLALEKIEKTLLILDDVRKYIDLQKVGIPLKQNGIKLIITTRLKHVCQQMDCLPDNTIIVHPFSEEEEEAEAWELFLLKLGHHETPATIAPEVLEIARSIVKKCDGLPLGISVMARTMKRENDIHWWRHALNKLNKLEMGEEMKEEVLRVLKRSYDNLTEKDLQKCFLYFAQHFGLGIKDDYVRKLVESGLLNGKMSVGEILDEGHVIVDKLVDHSLLLYEKNGMLRMHDLARNMACHILNESQNYMGKYNEKLKKIPQMQEWSVDLEAVFLMKNEIEEIPEDTSPYCPRLSVLILSDNYISHIPERFFTNMNALTLLDLSENPRLKSLPNSLSNLRSLISLVLKGCSELKYIPPLDELQALSRLDISYCSNLQVPRGLENLTSLTWLNLFQHANSKLKPLQGSALACLTNMRYLNLHGCSGIKVEDVKGMTMLDYFAGSFLDKDNYNHYVREIQDNGYGPQTYFIHFRNFENTTTLFYEHPIYSQLKGRTVGFGDCEELSYLLPRDLLKLYVSDNNQWECLCAALPSNGPLSLKDINIQKCTKLKSLFCVSCSLCTNIQNLESLNLDDLASLTLICKGNVADLTQSLSPRGVFSHLKEFHIKGCHQIEKLLMPGLVPQLQNLESISVSYCDSMKEIFAGDSFIIKLPKLTVLELHCLPQVKTVCNGILFCKYENILNKYLCPNLEDPRIRVVPDDLELENTNF